MYEKIKKMKIPIIDIKKYGGKQVAIVKGKIVASGVTTQEVLEKAKKKLPFVTWRDILLVSVPEGLTVVYPVRNFTNKLNLKKTAEIKETVFVVKQNYQNF